MRTRYRGFWMGLISVLGCAVACAAAPVPAYRLLILDSQRGNPYDEIRKAMTRSLELYGFVEGKNLLITIQITGNDVKLGETLLKRELARQRYDAIYTGGTSATISAKNAVYGDMQHKVIFAAPTDPVGIGVIKSFSGPPEANFSGVCYPVPVKARLRFIKQIMPQARTFGLIYADMPQSHSYVEWVQQLLEFDPEFKHFTVIFRKVPLVTGEHGDQLMAEAAARHVRAIDASVDAFIKPNDQMGTRRYFSEMVYKTASKPLIGLVRDDVMGQWGATAVVYPSHQSIGKQAAHMIKDVLQGRPIAEILPEWPKEYGFAVDLRKTSQFGVSVPLEILQIAGENIVK